MLLTRCSHTLRHAQRPCCIADRLGALPRSRSAGESFSPAGTRKIGISTLCDGWTAAEREEAAPMPRRRARGSYLRTGELHAHQLHAEALRERVESRQSVHGVRATPCEAAEPKPVDDAPAAALDATAQLRRPAPPARIAHRG